MAFIVDKVKSTVTIRDGAAGPADAAIDTIVARVIARLDDRAREAQRSRAATTLSRQASRPLDAGR